MLLAELQERNITVSMAHTLAYGWVCMTAAEAAPGSSIFASVAGWHGGRLDELQQVLQRGLRWHI